MTGRLRAEMALTQAQFDAFAALSGDANPIHVDPAFSAATKFKRTVSHGVLLVSILSGLIVRLRPKARIVAQAIRFPAPTFAQDMVAFEVVWRETRGGVDYFDCSVTRIGDGVVTCDGELAAA